MSRLRMLVLVVGMGLGCALTTSAQPFETIYSFGNGPANPRGNLTLGPDGYFYGTTASGGQYGEGAVFRVTTNGNLMMVASFGSFLKDGTGPYAGLTLGADGHFYGTTIAGGTNFLNGGTNSTGTIFRVTTNGALTTVASFTGVNGSYPESQLIIGPNGSFYGTTAYGGTSDLGTVFQVTTNGVLTMLASFSGTNGARPQAGLTLGLDGNFYGTTSYGGISNVGTIFQATPGGSLKTLVNFNTTNGAVPYGQLRRGSDGDLYGTTFGGGISSGPFQVTTNSSVGFFGTVFRVTTNGALTTLADLTFLGGFSGNYPGVADNIGWNPYGQLIQGADGGFYGTTSGGGTNGSGTIFRVSTNGTLAQLASLPNLQYQFLTNFLGFVFVNYTTNNFTNSSLIPLLNASVKKLYDFPPLFNTTNSTGAESHSGLTLGPDGNYYAAVYKGGDSGYGTIIRVTTNGAVTPLASFSGNTGSGIRAGLTLGPDGNLYGAAQLGGVSDIGTLFKWSRDGSVSTLHSFDWRPDGANPNASLTLGPDGNLYGTALNGGTNLMQTGPNSYTALSYGTVFRLTTNGVFTPIVYFNSTNGANPYSALTLLDGKFYGTTAYGGISNIGTVFQVTTNGALTTLASFSGTNGSRPYGRLAVGPNGNLYGMTGYGGISNVGTVFEISTQGVINTVFHFTGTNGSTPQSGLLWNSDGYFYGMTESGGSKKLGTIFKVTPGGALTTLASFGQTNGSSPSGELIKGPDGNLYGATSQGGTGFNGAVFRLNTNGTMTTLFSFPSTPLTGSFSGGYHPYSGLLLFTNGNFIHLYGTAFGGGNNGGGTIFQANLITYFIVPENTATLLNPLTNDVVWTVGGTLSLTGTSTTNGTATINGNGILVLPATNFIGSATLAYTFTDGSGQTNTSLIALLVTNIPPIANPDSAMIVENSATNSLNPLANDLVQTPGGTLGLVSVSTTNGTAVISGTNVLFTPATDYVGAVTIDYRVTDNIGGTNSSYITVQVTNAPSPSMADLSLSVSAAPEPVGVGSNLVYSITVSNAGPSVATSVVISNQVPAGVNFVSATGGATPSSGVLLVNLGSLVAGSETSAQVIVQPALAGNLTNRFEVFGDELDLQLGNNAATVISTVTSPVVPLMLDCSTNIVLSTDPGECSRSNVTYTVTFSGDGAILTQTAGLTNGATFPKGNTTNSFMVSDSQENSTTCSFTVTINDSELPMIICSTNIVATADPGQSSRSNVTFDVVLSDNCPGAVLTQTAGLPSGATFSVGTTTNRFTVTDASGNTNSCSFTVTINDTQPTAINCPGNLTFSTDLGQCSRSNVTYTVTFSGDGATLTQTGGLPSGSTFSKGTTTNKFTVSDVNGGSNTCSFTVTVNDNELPTINCPGNLTFTNNLGQCSRSNVTYSVTFSDNCPGTLLTQTAGLSSGSTFPKGTTTNRFTVTDASGNTNTCSFTVTINDTELPTINCPGNLTFTNNLGQCSRSNVTYSVTFSDNCPGATLTQTTGLPSGSTFPKGTTTNRFRVDDTSGNTNTCSFTVTINDTQPPTIVCPANIVVSAAEGATNAGVGFPPPVVTDNCPGASAVFSPSSGSAFPLGTSTVTLRATDAAGNTNVCTFTVTVNITLPGSLVAEFASAPMVLNRQTGLFEQSVRLRNLSGATVNASRVYVLNLPSTNSLYNRSGVSIPTGLTNPAPYVQYNLPLASGSNVMFLLEFYLPNLKAVTNHTLKAEVVGPADPPTVPNGAQAVPLTPGHNPLQLNNGRFLIEWTAIPGRTYRIQYSSDLTNWKTVVPSIIAPATSVQWIDDGPPKTETKPNQLGSRFYRVFLLPAN